MPRLKLSVDLKKEIANLTSKEKDKLLFRLLPKDDLLVEKLEFELIELKQTVNERRSDVMKKIENVTRFYPQFYESPRGLVSEMRNLSGYINRHRSVTGDKEGEIELQFKMLRATIGKNIEHLCNEGWWAIAPLNKYFVARCRKIKTFLSKMHEDLIIDYEEDIKEIGSYFESIVNIKEEAADQGFDYSLFQRGVIQ